MKGPPVRNWPYTRSLFSTLTGCRDSKPFPGCDLSYPLPTLNVNCTYECMMFDYCCQKDNHPLTRTVAHTNTIIAILIFIQSRRKRCKFIKPTSYCLSYDNLKFYPNLISETLIIISSRHFESTCAIYEKYHSVLPKPPEHHGVVFFKFATRGSHALWALVQTTIHRVSLQSFPLQMFIQLYSSLRVLRSAKPLLFHANSSGDRDKSEQVSKRFCHTLGD